MRRCIAVLGLCAASCGSDNTYNMPGSGITVPSVLPNSVQIGQSSNGQHGSAEAMPGQAITAAGGIMSVSHVATWHGKQNGQNSIGDHGTQTPCRSDLNPVGVPCPGSGKPSDPALTGYDAHDPDIIAAQNDEFQKNGIVPLVSWWGPVGSVGQMSGDLFLDDYLKISSPVQIILLYEVGACDTPGAGRLIFDGDCKVPFDDTVIGRENHRRFVQDMAHLNAKYFSRHPERFLQFDGKPGVFIWLSQTFRGDFASAAAEARKAAPVYLIGAEINAYAPPGPRDPAYSSFLNRMGSFDAVSAYGLYFQELTNRYGGHLTSAYAAEYVTGVMRYAQWARDNVPGQKIIAPVMFSYKDSRGNPPLTSTSKEARAFAMTVRSVLEQSAKNCGNILWLVLFVSYNEHYEGSSLEPTYEYGTSYLDIVREVFWQAGPPPGSCGN